MSSSSTPAHVIRFGVFEANLRSGELRKSGIKIKLHDQPFQVLTMLLERPGELVAREEIRNRLWPGETFVDFDHSVNNAVNRLREALGDSADSPRFIETLPRRGYRFVGQTNGTGFVEIGESSTAQSEGKSTEPINAKAIKSRAYHWLFGVGLMVAAVAGIVAYQFYRPPSVPSSRLFLLPPDGTTFNLIGDEGGSVAVSLDGTRIAFVTVSTPGNTEVWVRPLGSLTSSAVDGTDGGTFPFWSPDGRSIGFFAGGKLKTVSLDGSNSPLVLCDAPFGRGGSWSSRGVIIFAPSSHSAIYAIPDRGGEPKPVTVLDASTHTTHRWPKFLPDGKHFIYLAASHFNPPAHDGVYLGSLDGGRDNRLIVNTDADATYASGYLFFLRKDAFMAQRFSPETAELRGEPHATVEKVLYDPTIWKTVFDASSKGLMAYQLGDRVRGTQFRWFDRTGKQTGILGDPIFQWEPSISRDGQRLVVGIASGGYSNLWVYDLVRGGRMQITFSKYDSGTPVWLRRSSRILFTSKRQHYSIYEVDSRGAEPERLVLDTGSDTWPLDISPDERFLLFGRGLTIGKAKSEIWVSPMNGGGRQFRLLAGEAREGEAQFSPDGRWVAYTSNESGRDEIYVVPFAASISSGETHSAALQGKWKISDAGGHAPRWRRNAAELFYLASDNTVMAVPVSTRSSKFQFESARPLFRANPGFYSVSYDVSPDGSKFVVNTAPEERTAPITVVENWLSDLER